MNIDSFSNDLSTSPPILPNLSDSDVSPQSTILSSHPTPRSATDTVYLDIFETNNPDASKSYTVVGVEVILKPGHVNGLWERFHVKPDQTIDPSTPEVATQSLTICCDKLVIHSEMRVPECDIAIYTRHVDWATPEAKINTSPLAWSTHKAKDATGNDKKGANGARGRNAGSIAFFTSPGYTAEKSDDSNRRLEAVGGNGQGPGHGRRGTDGDSNQSYTSIDFSTSSLVATSKAKVSFNPPATYAKAGWYSAEIWMGWGAPAGSAKGPTSGTDAVASGIPGNGGNGGDILTNIDIDKAHFMVLSKAGLAGADGPGSRGGYAGRPTKCAHYEVLCWHNLFGTKNATTKKKITKNIATTSGNSSNRTHGEIGHAPVPQHLAINNAWLHPLAVQKVLYYVRDIYLAGAYEQVGSILKEYNDAMTSVTPPELEQSPWTNDEGGASWSGAKCEVSALIQRLCGHLDYYGHPAGYTPALSLSSAVALYEKETDSALQTLLLTEWIDAKKNNTSEAITALSSAIDELNRDTTAASTQVSDAENKINSASNSIDNLKFTLNELGQDLEDVRNKLMEQAMNDERKKAAIKFGVHMISAAAQVIPYGQPILGTVAGSLAGVADRIVDGGDSAVPDTVSKAGEIFTAVEEAKKAAAAATLAKEKARKDVPDGSEAAKSIAEASKQAKIAGLAGAGLGEVGKAIQALQVPQTEIDAALQKLLEESAEWNELVDKVKKINAQMLKFSVEILQGLQLLSDGYARISSNSAAVVTMERARSDKLGLLDPSAIGFVKTMGQRSRLTLTYYLYLMVKTYETTLLKPINNINWNLDDITIKINKLISDGKLNDFNASDVKAQVEVLKPLYQQNIFEVQRHLLSDLNSGGATMETVTLERGFTKSQTPELIEQINVGEKVILDPLSLGLVRPDRHLAFLNKPSLTKCIFADGSPKLPKTTTMMINLQPDNKGIVRRDANLYTLNSLRPLIWSWTVTNSGINETVPAPITDDIIKFVLGSESGNIKQLLARSPIWSDYSLNITYNPPLSPEERPIIEELIFEFKVDSSQLVAPADNLCVLRIQPLNSFGENIIQCSPDDNGEPQRGDGSKQFIRIYNKGTRVKLSIPNSQPEGYHFCRWSTSGQSAASFKDYEEGQCTIEITLTENILADAHWSNQPLEVQSFLKSVDGSDENLVYDESIAEEQHYSALLLHDEANDASPIIAQVPDIDSADVYDTTHYDGWTRVNYHGIIGWAKHS